MDPVSDSAITDVGGSGSETTRSAPGPARELFPPDPPLSDGSVVLRPWVEIDVEVLAMAGRDPLIRRFRGAQPATEAEIRDWLAQAESCRLRGERLELAIAIRGETHALGAITLWLVNLTDRDASVNYWVAAEARGRGVAARAMRLLARWCFEELGLARLNLFIEPTTVASRRVAQQCGFVEQGRLPSAVERDGTSYDVLVYGLLPDQLR